MGLETAKWCGYEFDVHEPDDDGLNVSGVYVFAARRGRGWNPLYVGETGSFKTRLGNIEEHHDWKNAVERGATHVHARRVGGRKARRQKIEGEIYDEHKPKGELPLNDKIPPGSKDAPKESQVESHLRRMGWY